MPEKMQGKLAVLTGGRDVLDQLAAHLGEPLFHYVERVEDVRLGRGVPGETWPAGRLFSPRAEVRWSAIGGSFRYTFSTEGGLPELDWELVDGNWTVRDREEFMLWGSKTVGGGVWVEIRIPRLLEYPVDGLSRDVAVVVGCRYIKEGVSRLVRLMEVK